MSRETSRGIAPIVLLCEAFGITRQAYYAAKWRGRRSGEGRRIPRP
jgi:hypothetical protein